MKLCYGKWKNGFWWADLVWRRRCCWWWALFSHIHWCLDSCHVNNRSSLSWTSQNINGVSILVVRVFFSRRNKIEIRRLIEIQLGIYASTRVACYARSSFAIVELLENAGSDRFRVGFWKTTTSYIESSQSRYAFYRVKKQHDGQKTLGLFSSQMKKVHFCIFRWRW